MLLSSVTTLYVCFLIALFIIFLTFLQRNSKKKASKDGDEPKPSKGKGKEKARPSNATNVFIDDEAVEDGPSSSRRGKTGKNRIKSKPVISDSESSEEEEDDDDDDEEVVITGSSQVAVPPVVKAEPVDEVGLLFILGSRFILTRILL